MLVDFIPECARKNKAIVGGKMQNHVGVREISSGSASGLWTHRNGSVLVRCPGLLVADDVGADAFGCGHMGRWFVRYLGAQGYTVMQLMQIIGERNVRIVPDVAVTGANSNPGLVDGLLGVMLKAQSQVVRTPTEQVTT